MSVDNFRFLFDGNRLDSSGNDTFETLDFEDEDQIDVLLEQHGGFIQLQELIKYNYKYI